MMPDQEAAYERGIQAGLTRALRLLLREIGPTASSEARLLLERAEAVAMLRSICTEHGDNDWPDELHLADVIDKHLARHLRE